jgi:hypothetical protein
MQAVVKGNITSCTLCPLDTYSDGTGPCAACPDGSTTNKNTGQTFCICSSGFALVTDPTTGFATKPLQCRGFTSQLQLPQTTLIYTVAFTVTETQKIILTICMPPRHKRMSRSKQLPSAGYVHQQCRPVQVRLQRRLARLTQSSSANIILSYCLLSS